MGEFEEFLIWWTGKKADVARDSGVVIVEKLCSYRKVDFVVGKVESPRCNKAEFPTENFLLFHRFCQDFGVGS